MVKRLVLMVTFLIALLQAQGQDRSITGKVIDESGNTLPGATVSLKGTSKATVTDINGSYTLTVPPTGGELVFSYIGYQTKTIELGADNIVDVNLETDVTTLNEIVVIGYGVQKKSLVTGAIAKVESKDIAGSTSTRFEQAIQGKTSGVIIAQNSGAPGAGLTIKIRGNSSDGNNNPLYIVDGIKTGGLEYLNPSDIESIEILKDAASAAILGADGGNGVILITTKKGTKGESKIEYGFTHGVQKATNLPSVMTGNQYRQYFMEAATWENKAPKYTQFSQLDSIHSTDWVNQIFDSAPMDEHNLSFTGGSDKTRYYVSGSYLTQDGIVGGSKNNFTRYSFRSNVETEIKSWFSLGNNISYTRAIKNNFDATNEYGGIINDALNYDPTIPVYYNDTSEILPKYKSNSATMEAWNRNSNGKYYSKSEITTGEAWNPVAQIDAQNEKQIQDKIVADLHADFKPVNWAKFTSRIFVDYAYQKKDKFTGKNFYGVDPIIADSNTFVEQSWDRWYKYGIENFASFNFQIAEHGLEVMLGQSYEDYAHYYLYTKFYNIPYASIDYAFPYVAQDNKRFSIGDQTQYPDYSRVGSYFGRFVYNYKERYMLQGNFRRDGASNFGSDKKWGVFPSFSAGWTVSKEDFFNSSFLSFINNFKLRGSWGQNGSRQVLGPYPYVSTMQVVYYSNATPAGSKEVGKVPGIPANNALMWETSEQTNFGADLSFFRNAVTFSVDWYKKSTKGQLADKADLPTYLGFQGNPKVNSGQIDNKGWEFELAYTNKINELIYNVSFNATYITNEVVSYGVKQGKDGANIGQLGVVNRYDVGNPVWYFYGYKALGIFQDTAEINHYGNIDPITGKFVKLQSTAKPGDVKYADIPVDSLGGVGNGKIDGNDRTYLGKPMPDWTFGLNIGCEFKGFDINIFFQGVTGNQIYWAGYRNDRTEYNKSTMWYDNRWTGPGTSNKYPRATNTDANGNFKVSSLNVYNGDYLRLKNLTFGYTLPQKLTTKIFVTKLRVYFTATNLVSWTKYPGTDPEVGMYDTNNNYSYGIDKGLYPPTKINTIGVSVTF